MTTTTTPTLKLTQLNAAACLILMNGIEYAQANGLSGAFLARARKRAAALQEEYRGTGKLDALCERWQSK